jgi:hypothetical protein
MPQINFYATYDDISKVLEQFEAEQRAIYVLTGLFDVESPQIFQTYKAINSLSVSIDGDANRVPGYLIVTEPDRIAVREVPQKIGGKKFAVDQLLIPDSLYFQSGGMFSKEIIVPGKIGIVYQTHIAGNLYGSFAKIIRRTFSKVKSYWVGREAYALWENGMRLGLGLNASADIDLKK